MHVVKPIIRTITSDEDINLKDVNKVTIINNGSETVNVGFDNRYLGLPRAAQTSFESGSNSWFGERTSLQIRFQDIDDSETVGKQEVAVIICQIEKPSNIFLDAVQNNRTF